ncbi:MAG: hypothetical protein KDD36_09750 [Flavobacteriales bacterium]|nr:hypothetical protein [Flavobacteriales bacterium]
MPEQNIITIHRGPMFRGKRSFLGIGGTSFGSIFIILALNYGAWVVAIISALLIIPLISLAIGQEGVEIDTKKKTVRLYRLFLRFRYGVWHPITLYHEMVLIKDYWHTNRSIVKTSVHRSSYNIVLRNQDNSLQLVLIDTNNYNDACEALSKLEKSIDLPVRNIVKDLNDSARVTRRKKGRR